MTYADLLFDGEGAFDVVNVVKDGLLKKRLVYQRA